MRGIAILGGLALAGCDGGSGGAAATVTTPEGSIAIDVAGVPDLATGVVIAVRADPPAPVTVRCDAADDRWSTTREAAAEVEVRWYGLVPRLTYVCSAVAGGRDVAVTFTTPAGPADVPPPVVTGATTGLTLFNHAEGGEQQRLVVIDPAGRVRWYHALDGDPNAGIESAFVPETTRGPVFLAGGGEGYHPTLIALDGAELWSVPDAVAGGEHHHDTLWLPGEEILALSWAEDQLGSAVWDGFALETVRAWTGERTWSWRSQTAVDRGQLPPFTDAIDAYHANAVTAHPDDPEGASYFVSLKRLHQIARLDVATGDVTWRLGVGGDFQLLEADGRPADPARWFYGQHAPEAHNRPDGLWDVWIHDNGMDRPGAGPLASRALRLEVDVAARTARIAWEWTEPGWYEPVFGDIDLLDDGHVLVTMGHCPHCPGGSDDRRTGLVEIDPATDRVAWRADMLLETESGYRAQRIDGCALLPDNETLCPAGAP